MLPIVVDIETNLAHNKIWCAATYDLETREQELFLQNSGRDLRKRLEGREVVAHNGIGFDFPRLAKYWDIVIPIHQQIDTLIMSRLHNPNIDGGHSLKVWGERLSLTDDDGKMEFAVERFDEGYCAEMGLYCLKDAEVNARLYETLAHRMDRDGFSPRSIRMEHEIADITRVQEESGFLLDMEHATNIYVEHIARMNAIEDTLQQRFPPIITERYSEKTGKRLKDGVEVFNVGSRQQVAKRLEGLGAKWKKKTETGKWVVNETTLAEIDLPEAKLVEEYLTLQKRSGMVDSWIAAVKDDGRVHGRVQTLGAVTGRMTHSSPNMAQIPAAPLYRQCWTVPPGFNLVGCDASQLELRLLAHYMQDAAYVDQILHGDIHSYNQDAAGLLTRDQAKTFIYALIYGAGDKKIGEIVGGNASDGKDLKRRFMAKLPAYSRLVAKVEGIAEGGVLPGLDGRRIRVRHQHAALNTLLQGGGAVVMKAATVDLMNRITHLPAHLVAQVHDEVQLQVMADYAEEVGETAVDCLRETENTLALRCPMDGEWKIGKTWAETH